MRRSAALLACAGLALALGWGCPAGTADARAGAAADLPPDSAMLPWVPSESWPGGAQYDPRLERTVRFWGAGMPLREVFAGVKEQTEVEMGFWPAGDVNERICVTLYLNPERPPTLRELMAQLSWVTDCTFACSEEEPRLYWLLSTSAGSGALERLFDWADRETNARSWRRDEIATEMRQAAEARLADLREALTVPEEDLVETYHGVDDPILLAVLDPPRRAFSRFLVSLSQEDLQVVQPRRPLVRPWSEWAPAQREMLREAMRPSLEEQATGLASYFGEPGRWDDWDWVETRLDEIHVGFSDSGAFHCEVWVPEPGGDGAMGMVPPGIQLVVDPREQHSVIAQLSSQIDLRRLLGEEISEEEERRATLEGYEAWGRRELQEEVRRQLLRQHPLKPENEGLLASLTLPIEPTKPYSLWQLQELVAARSGLHVVSDCFWQPERSLRLPLDKLYLEGEPELNALTVLRAATIPAESEIGVGILYLSDGGVSWEWGDAGDFLRFRGSHRDACRDVFLSEEAVLTLNHWVDAALPDDVDEADGEAVEVPLEPRECGRLLRMLTPAQRRYGWHLIYGGPADVRNGYRHAFRVRFREALGDLHPYLLLARLSERQWERLQTEGLTWGGDVLLEPEGYDRDRWSGGWRAYKEDDELRLEDVGDGQRQQVGVTSWKRFYVHREGWDPPRNRPWDDWLASGVVVKPKSTERLVHTDVTVGQR